MDEYVGLPRDHPESYHTFMFREFFSHSMLHLNTFPNGLMILNDTFSSRYTPKPGQHSGRKCGRFGW